MVGTLDQDDDSDAEQALLEALALEVRAAELSSAQRERMRERIMMRIQDEAPAGTSTLRVARAKWVEVCFGVQMQLLQRDAQAGRQTILLKMQPGGEIPRHRHTQDEEFLVLEGECSIGTHHLRAGDFHAASAGSWHERTTTTTGVLVMLRGEYPVPISVP
jgi:anti-sigma factor ChrR (cupin superfamily)